MLLIIKLDWYRLLNKQYSKGSSFSCPKHILFLANYSAKNNNNTRGDSPHKFFPNINEYKKTKKSDNLKSILRHDTKLPSPNLSGSYNVIPIVPDTVSPLLTHLNQCVHILFSVITYSCSILPKQVNFKV